jgi:hypothetical protein
MTTESQVTTPDVTEIPSGESAVTPEIAGQDNANEAQTPEGGEGTKPEPTAAERAAKALERRVARLTREKYQLSAQLEQTRQVPQPNGEQETLTPDEVERRADEKARAMTETQRLNDRSNQIYETGVKAFKGDFDKALSEIQQISPLFDAKGKPVPLMQAIFETDEPHKVLHYLGTNLDVAEELADMSPLRAARMLGQIEADLAKKPEPKPSNAPKPLQPVKAAAAGSAPDPSKDPEGWAKWRNEQTHGKR